MGMCVGLQVWQWNSWRYTENALAQEGLHSVYQLKKAFTAFVVNNLIASLAEMLPRSQTSFGGHWLHSSCT